MPTPTEAALAEAQRAVLAANLPPDWQPKAFDLVLRHLLGGARADNSSRAASAPADLPAGGLGRLGITEAAFADLTDFDAATKSLKLALPSSKVESTKSGATRQLSLMVVSARLALELDQDAVDSQHVRSALEEYNRYDMANFSAHLKKFEEEMNSSKKDGKLLFRLRRQGWERAAELWREAAGEAE